MFTGIVQTKAPIVWISHSPTLTRYGVDLTGPMLEGLVRGASVSIQGICQTVVSIENTHVIFEAIEETLACTTVPLWKEGDYLNIERSLRMGDEIGGHLLSGHIMGTGCIQNIEHPSKEQAIITVKCDPKWMKYLLPKGYIALNGVSLTLGKMDPSGWFTVNLIPETRYITTFGECQLGDKVNIEIDSQTQAIVDTIERVLEERKL